VHIGEQNVIMVQLESQMEMNLFRDASKELRHFLAESMDNNTFDLEFSVVESAQVVARPYTTMEKYKKMEEINPAIRDLREQLGLELDI
jgi:tRNA threonylcarbamoyladenosine modification (KEOPS) complex Cgi121 subunit